MTSPPPPPPPPRRRTFRRTFGKNFLGHFKKNIVQRNVAEKKILASNPQANPQVKKKFVHRKIAQPPPQISNGPPLRSASWIYLVLKLIKQHFNERKLCNI